MRSPLIALACATLLLATNPAQAQSVDLAKSQISFGFKQENVPGEGRFRKFTAQVTFDPVRLDATRAAVEVEVGSVDLGDPGWNNDIQGASWFNARQFPKAAFSVAGARALAGGRYEAAGKFTLKGATRDVLATFTAKTDAGGTLLEGMVPLRRNDYKIGDGAWADTSVVADEVAVRFRIYLKK